VIRWRPWKYVLSLMLLSAFVWTQEKPGGRVQGFIYEKDGTTPVVRAVVILEEVFTGEALESSPSDSEGRFFFPFVERGLFRLGVRTPGGTFNAPDPLGVRPGEGRPAVLAINLTDVPASGVGGLFPNAAGSARVVCGNAAVLTPFGEIEDKPREAGPFRPFPRKAP